MSVLDMDVSVRRTPQSIRKRRFAVVRRGFDPDQVRAYLDEIAGWIEQLESELNTAREELDAAARRAEQPVDPYGRLGARVAELMRTAEEQAERIHREAEQEASRKLDDLQGEVDRIRTESRAGAERLRREAEQEAARMQAEATQTLERARTEASQTLDRARGEANSVLAALTGQRDMLVTELRATRRRLSELVGAIDDTVESTPAFPLAGPGGTRFDPWADPPAVPQAPQPARTPEPDQAPMMQGPESAPADAPTANEPEPVPVAEPVEGSLANEADHVDPFEGRDPAAAPPAGAGLFDDLDTGPSYEGMETGEPLFEDPEPGPHSYGDAEERAGYATNGFQAGGIGHSEFGEPASFELPAGENLDLGQYAEDEPEVTPTIELSLPDIPSFEDEEAEEGEPE